VVLAAQYKSGKTSLVGNLARCLVDGDLWLESAVVRRVEKRLTILDFEMDLSKAKAWLRDQGIMNADQINFVALRGCGDTFNILDPGVRAQWAQMLEEHGTEYLVLDCLRPVLDALGLDEHRDAGRFFGPFDALLKEAGVQEALVVHHSGHNGERSRGDSRIRDWPDVEWRMMRMNDNPSSERFITAFGRDVEVAEHRLAYDETTRHLWLETGNRVNKDAVDALDGVLSVLREASEPLSMHRLQKALKDAEHPASRRDIEQAVKMGIFTSRIESAPGLHNATLYSIPRGWVSSRFGGIDE
jgi:hypothetical protein